MTVVDVRRRVEETAFIMLGLPPTQREQLFNAAFEHVIAKRPDLQMVPPSVVAFVAAVLQWVAELEHRVGHA